MRVAVLAERVVPTDGGPLVAYLVFVSMLFGDRYDLGDPEDFMVVLGEHDRTEPDWESRRRKVYVDEIIVHEKYVGIDNYWKNDVALIKLAEKVDFNDNICPVCLPNTTDRTDIINCWATGWGKEQGNVAIN